MPGYLNTACPPPRKAKTAPRPVSRNVVEVEKLKTENVNQEPGVDKKNVKFLFGLLEEASNERQQLMKQLAVKDETIAMISKQRELEEASFRKVLTTERKKFDKKILDARNMLQRRENLLRLWAEIGLSLSEMNEEDSEESIKIAGLLRRTCKIVPDCMNETQKKKYKIEKHHIDQEQEDRYDEGFEDENENGDDENDEGPDVEDNSVGGNTMSESILMGNAGDKTSHNSKGGNSLNMGSGIQDLHTQKENVNKGETPANIQSMSISELAGNDGSMQVMEEEQFDSMNFHTLSNISEDNKSKTSSKSKKGSKPAAVSSSSYHEPSQNSKSKSSQKKTKKGAVANKKFESASLDLSDTSSKKYWWDHLVDDSIEKKDGTPSDLVLGSKLDKVERKSIDNQKAEEEEGDEKENAEKTKFFRVFRRENAVRGAS